MKKRLALVLLAPTLSHATPILDQSSSGLRVISFCAVPIGDSPSCEWQQQVTAGVTGLWTGLDLGVGGTGEFQIEYWSSGSTFNTAAPDAVKSFSVSNAGPFVSLDVSDLGITLTAGKSFLFEFTALTAGLGLTGYVPSIGNLDPYPGGTLGIRRGDDVYDDFRNANEPYDLRFRTYVDPVRLAVSEPSSLALLGLGLTGIALAQPRRRRTRNTSS